MRGKTVRAAIFTAPVEGEGLKESKGIKRKTCSILYSYSWFRKGEKERESKQDKKKGQIEREERQDRDFTN